MLLHLTSSHLGFKSHNVFGPELHVNSEHEIDKTSSGTNINSVDDKDEDLFEPANNEEEQGSKESSLGSLLGSFFNSFCDCVSSIFGSIFDFFECEQKEEEKREEKKLCEERCEKEREAEEEHILHLNAERKKKDFLALVKKAKTESSRLAAIIREEENNFIRHKSKYLRATNALSVERGKESYAESMARHEAGNESYYEREEGELLDSMPPSYVCHNPYPSLLDFHC